MESPSFPCPVCGAEDWQPGLEQTWDCVNCAQDGPRINDQGTNFELYYQYQLQLYDHYNQYLAEAQSAASSGGILERARVIRLQQLLDRHVDLLKALALIAALSDIGHPRKLDIEKGGILHLQWD